MAITDSTVPLSSLLDTLNSSLSSATAANASTIFNPESDALKNGISLLTTKNELLLSYLQNLVFLIILKLRSGNSEHGEVEAQLGRDVVAKLVELRTYMERGVKPLEGRLKYQIEKVIKAADDADRTALVKKAHGRKAPKTKSSRIMSLGNGAEGSDDSNNESDSEDSDAESSEPEPELDELSYRPNPSALQPQASSASSKAPSSSFKTSSAQSGAYRPPRINPVSMPATSTSRESSSRNVRPQKSALMDDFITSELSTAPTAEPSIGSLKTFTSRGRKTVSQRERNEAAERQTYEEENFVRLPGESKTERRKKAKNNPHGERGGYGGEEFKGLGDIGDRISRAVGRKEKGGDGVLGRSRKRGPEQSGGEGNSLGMGEGFEKRRRILEDRKKRKGKQ